jgi:hypothetical protein
MLSFFHLFSLLNAWVVSMLGYIDMASNVKSRAFDGSTGKSVAFVLKSAELFVKAAVCFAIGYKSRSTHHPSP